VLGQRPNQSVTTKDESECFNDRRFAAIVRTNQNSMVVKLNLSASNPAKIFNFQ